MSVAQLVERWTVTPEVAGSNPVAHPSYNNRCSAKRDPIARRGNSTKRLQRRVFIIDSCDDRAISSIGRAADS